MAKNIDDLLFGLTDMALPEEETTRDQVKQALYEDLLELIGKDEPKDQSFYVQKHSAPVQPNDDPEPVLVESYAPETKARNDLRQQQRQALATYFGVEE